MKLYTDLENDLQIIEDFFTDEDDYENSLAQMCQKMDITPEEYDDIKLGINKDPSKMQLENIYNYAYNRGLFLNEITWQECLDEHRKNKVKVCTHGARSYIKGAIKLNVNSIHNTDSTNDFADGFYIGQDISQACMFVSEDPNSSLYFLTFDPKGLKCAYFAVDEEWMLAIGLFRGRLDAYKDNPKLIAIQNKIDNCDFVFAPIADNKLFEVIDAFIDGELTNLQCLYALSATHLGYQYVLKTPKALNNLQVLKHLYYCGIEKSLYNKEADVETNTSMNKATIAKKKYKNQGKYITEILG